MLGMTVLKVSKLIAPTFPVIRKTVIPTKVGTHAKYENTKEINELPAAKQALKAPSPTFAYAIYV
jgi:hypothetical protein